jgi:hypothetical protein
MSLVIYFFLDLYPPDYIFFINGSESYFNIYTLRTYDNLLFT